MQNPLKTLIRRASAMLVGLVCTSLTITQLPLQGQTRRAGPPGPPRETPTRTIEAPTVSRELPSLISSLVRGQAMGTAFRTGRLPEPLRKPQGTGDEVAALLAKKVSARDKDSLPALLAAIMNAGFAIRDADGSITQTVDPGQGLVFDAWEVAAMAKNYGEGKTTTLKYLADGLKSIPALKVAPLDQILLQGIRDHAKGNQPLMRFWARFIVELGRNSERPYDMLVENNAEGIRLDAAQVALILQRLSGDLYSLAKKQLASAGADKVDAANANYRARRSHVPRGFAKRSNHADSSRALEQNRPCKNLGQGDGALILDAAASTITTGWDKLLDYLGKELAGAILATLNIIFAYAKFIATYAALETEITVENPPLVRTTDSVPGERRRLTAKVKLNLGKAENINCFRTALNVAAGLDISLLSDGPLDKVGVNWHLVEGGAGDFYSNRGGITGTHQIVGFWNGSKRIQDAGSYAGIPGKGGTPVSDATRTITNKDGVASTFLEGSPHVPYVPQPHLAEMKRAVVMTTVRLKGGDLKGDAVDVYGQVLGGVAGLITMPLELLYRTDWASTATLEVPVKDWKTCERGWHGTITITGKLKEQKDEMPGGPRGWRISATREITKNFKYTFVLNGIRDTSDGSQNGYVAEVRVEVDNSNILTEKTRHVGFCDTGARTAGGSKITKKVDAIETITFSDLLNGNGASKTTVYIASRGAAGYNILIDAPSPITGKHIQSNEYKVPECPLWEQVNSHFDERQESIFPPTLEFLIPLDDPQNPNILSNGRTDRDARSDGTITYKWDLQLCR